MVGIVTLGTTALISEALYYCDNVADPTAAEYTSRRVRYLLYLQKAAVDFWMEKEWSWSMRATSLAAISAEGMGTLPAGFLEVGRSGNLIDTATNLPLTSIDPGAMRVYLESDVGSSKEYIYSIYSGKDGDGDRYLWVPKGWVGTTTLSLHYKRIPPLCVDGATDELEEIPATYQYSVLTPKLFATAFRSLGNPQADIEEANYIKGVAKAVSGDPGTQRDSVSVMGGYGIGRKMC